MINKFNYIKQNIRLTVFATVSIVALSMFFDIKPFIYLLIFCVGNALFLTYERYIEVPLELEFSTFSSVLMSVNYGLFWGVTTAALTKLAAVFYNKDLNMNTVFTLTGYMMGAVIAALLGFDNIIILGMTVVLINNTYGYMISKFITYLPFFEAISYAVSNFMFNLVLFVGFAHILTAIM